MNILRSKIISSHSKFAWSSKSNFEYLYEYVMKLYTLQVSVSIQVTLWNIGGSFYSGTRSCLT